METKYCPSCKNILPKSCFWKNSNRYDGLQSICSKCHYNKYNVNKDKIKQRKVSKKHYYFGGGKEKKQEYAKTEKGKQVIKESQAKHRKSGKKRKSQLERLYGITTSDYNDMLVKQKGLCYICGKLSTANKKLCVNHNHITGKIRGLLCNGCNLRLGWYEINEQRIKQYLKKEH